MYEFVTHLWQIRTNYVAKRYCEIVVRNIFSFILDNWWKMRFGLWDTDVSIFPPQWNCHVLWDNHFDLTIYFCTVSCLSVLPYIYFVLHILTGHLALWNLNYSLIAVLPNVSRFIWNSAILLDKNNVKHYQDLSPLETYS
jgi:hypothetical protein